MPGLTFTRRANQEIAELEAWSNEHFGEDLTRRYVDRLEQCILDLCTRPLTGRLVEGTADVRRQRCISHYIFYRVHLDALQILRVLHVRRSTASLIFPKA